MGAGVRGQEKNAVANNLVKAGVLAADFTPRDAGPFPQAQKGVQRLTQLAHLLAALKKIGVACL